MSHGNGLQLLICASWPGVLAEATSADNYVTSPSPGSNLVIKQNFVDQLVANRKTWEWFWKNPQRRWLANVLSPKNQLGGSLSG